jgi:hypothetical protein
MGSAPRPRPASNASGFTHQLSCNEPLVYQTTTKPSLVSFKEPRVETPRSPFPPLLAGVTLRVDRPRTRMGRSCPAQGAERFRFTQIGSRTRSRRGGPADRSAPCRAAASGFASRKLLGEPRHSSSRPSFAAARPRVPDQRADSHQSGSPDWGQRRTARRRPHLPGHGPGPRGPA